MEAARKAAATQAAKSPTYWAKPGFLQPKKTPKKVPKTELKPIGADLLDKEPFLLVNTPQVACPETGAPQAAVASPQKSKTIAAGEKGDDFDWELVDINPNDLNQPAAQAM